MKISSTKAFLLLVLTLCNAMAFSQTVINYQTWTDASGCNIFSSSTNVPATINGSAGNVAHLTAIGSPVYDNTNKSVNLDAKIVSFQNQGTEYRISYNFKANSSYKITVNATRIMSTQSGPYVILRLDLNSGGSGNNTQCTGPGTIDASGSGGLKRSQTISDPAFANYEFTWPALSAAQSFLMVAAIPPAGAVAQTVLIRKITIEETTSVPTPSFSVSQSATSIACGNTDAVTFTVNNNNNTSGITGYTWNLGATPNNWLLNGSPAPASFSTGTTNTVALTPVCGATPSGVTATVSAGGNTYPASNTATVTVSAPSLSINGSGQVCGGSATYFIDNLPCNASVSWSLSSGSIASLSCTSCSSPTLTRSGDGLVTLFASVTNACGGPVALNKPNIQLGVPPVYLGAYSGSSSAENGEVILTDHNRAFLYLSSNNGYTSSTWTREPSSYSRFSITPLAFGVIGNFPTNAPAYSSGLVSVSVTHPCGTANGSFVFTYEGSGSPLMAASPNPANASLNVTVGETAPGAKAIAGKAGAAPAALYRVEILDKNGNIMFNKSYSGGTTSATLDVSSLKSDVYTLRTFTGKEWLSKKIIIQH